MSGSGNCPPPTNWILKSSCIGELQAVYPTNQRAQWVWRQKWVFQRAIFRPWIPGLLSLYHGTDLAWPCSCAQDSALAVLCHSLSWRLGLSGCLPPPCPLHLQQIDPYTVLFKGLSCIILACPRPGERTMKRFSDDNWVCIYCLHLLLWLK